MAKKLQGMMWWIDRWMTSSAQGLPLEARGLYREMLDHAWVLGGKLPDDPARIRRMCGADPEEWERSWPLVRAYWRSDGGGWLRNETLTEVFSSAEELASQRSEMARSAAVARWGGGSQRKRAQPMRNACVAHAASNAVSNADRMPSESVSESVSESCHAHEVAHAPLHASECEIFPAESAAADGSEEWSILDEDQRVYTLLRIGCSRRVARRYGQRAVMARIASVLEAGRAKGLEDDALRAWTIAAIKRDPRGDGIEKQDGGKTHEQTG